MGLKLWRLGLGLGLWSGMRLLYGVGFVPDSLRKRRMLIWEEVMARMAPFRSRCLWGLRGALALGMELVLILVLGWGGSWTRSSGRG